MQTNLYKCSDVKIACTFARFFLLVALCANADRAFAQKQNFPAYSGHVNDFASILDSATRTQLETILLNFENLTGAQIAVVTISTLGEQPIEEYSNGLYRSWGIGAKSGANKDKGAMLLIVPQDRRSRLEVGYGLEGDLPDGLAGEMLRRMRPYFKEERWSEGVTLGVRTLVDTLAEKWGVSVEGIDRQYAYRAAPQRPSGSSSPIGMLIFFAVMIVIFLLIARASRRRGGPSGGSRNSGWSGPMIFGSGGGDFGCSSDSSWDSGGSDWGGFGGGSSGGGGASDSW